jgi:NTP pyrophosphatase (non-canonical NTP hydrolase)
MRAMLQKAKNGKRATPEDIQHELGKELSVIFACCFLLRDTLQESLSKEQRRQLRRIEHSAARIRDLSAVAPRSGMSEAI